MDFRTEIEVAPSRFKISTDSKIMTVGSCFSEVIGGRLTDYKLQCLSNPYGTVFNPYSIFKLINQSLQNQSVFEQLMLENNGIWQHFDFHSKFYAHSKEKLEQELNLTHKKINQFLQKTDFLVLTFGTSIVHQLRENNQIVSNCHKTPASSFKKEMLSMEEILLHFRPMYEALKKQNSKLKIILTLSPVRHTRETLPLNSVSKSILRTACYHLEQDFNDVQYFPSYEIMIDDLRDYRFYKADMIHPNEQAEQYIFEKFASTYFTEDLNTFLKEWNKVKISLNHRPIQTNTPAHQKFLVDLLEKLEVLSKKIDVSTEIEKVRSQIIAS